MFEVRSTFDCEADGAAERTARLRLFFVRARVASVVFAFSDAWAFSVALRCLLRAVE